MSDDLTSEAVTALRSAAERLGVDPYRLARFLSDGRLSEILDVLGRPSRDGKESRRFELAEAYLEFLESEISHSEGKRQPFGRKPGA